MTISAYRSAFVEHKKTFTLLSISSLFLFGSFTATAEEATAVDIETINVSATRQDSPLNKVAGGVTVLTSEDIKLSNASSLVELLSTTPGLNIVQSGSLGGQTSLFVRGTESNHTAIMINGQQQKVSLGSVSLQYVDLNQIERIEILRSPQSSLHGSDAIGGVINIITKQGGSGSSLTLENGSNKLQSISATTSGAKYNLNLSSKRTEGIDSLIADTQNDTDEFKLDSGSVSFFLNPIENLDTTINLSGQRGQAEYDNVPLDLVTFAQLPSTLPETEFKTHNLSIQNRLDISEDWRFDLNIGQSRSENREFDNPFSAIGNFNKFTHNIATLNAHGNITDQISVAGGVDISDDTWEQANGFKESIGNEAAFAIVNYEDNLNIVDLSVRHDDNEQYGKHNTYNVSYQLNLSPEFIPYVSVGTGFKAPDFSEIFSASLTPNPDLQPETSENKEIGLKSQSVAGRFNVSIFQNDIDDFIIYDFLTKTLENVEEAQIKGIELSHSISINNLALSSNASYIRAFNTTNDTELLRRPRKTANINLNYDFGKVGSGKLRAGIGAHGEGDRLDFATALPGFVTANANLSYEVNENTQIRVKANNILDKEYQVIDGYLTDGANFTASITANF